MNLALSETQQLLQRSARAFLADACPPSLVRRMAADPAGIDRDLWRAVVDLGWTGLLVPEQFGGIGGSILDAVVLYEQIGHFLPPVPLFETAVTAALFIDAAGSDDQRATLLPAIAAGDRILSLAYVETDGSWASSSIQARITDDRLRGEKLFVADAHVADRLIAVYRDTAGPRAALVDPKGEGVRLTPLETIGQDRQFAVLFDGAPAEPLPGGWSVIDAAIDRATVVACAEMVGSCQHVLDMTVAYAKQRVAFGRPIGAFQAIQHECAELAARILGLRLLVYETAWKLATGEAALDVSICKDMAGELFRDTTTAGHQIHAGLAFTRDHDMQLFHRRVPAADFRFGDSDFHKARAADLLAL